MMAETMIPSPVKNEHNTRKNKKPLMEKRRRARINSCLSQLKALVLQAIKKDSSQFSKLEKADILELTVKHLRALQRQQAAGVMTQDVNVVSKYRAGFNECAKEVARYMGSVREMGDDVKEQLLGHLAGCLQVVNHVSAVDSMQQQHLKPLHVHIPPQQPVTTVTPSIIMPLSQTSLHSGLNFNPVAVRTSAPAECVTSSSTHSTLPMQHVPTATTTATTVVSHNPSPISGAFKIVPSTSCPTGAVALYVGAGGLQRPDAVNVDAVPLYSVSVPPAQTDNAVTAFITPPATSHLAAPMDRGNKMDVAHKAPESTSLSSTTVPVDLRQPYSGKVMDTACYPVSMGQCSPSSLSEEKLWRPW